jgi:Domain of unknown function (DUF4383)
MVDTVALLFGCLYLLVGVVGFILAPGGGMIFGIFPVNMFHHVFHITFGGLGLVAGWMGRGRLYCQIVGVVFLVLGLLGVIVPPLTAALLAHPGADLLTDNLLHLMTGIALSYFGFLPRPKSLRGSGQATDRTG